MATRTATKNTAKTAAETAEAAAETAAETANDMLTKAQDQYFAALTEVQNLALDAYRSVVDSVTKLNLPDLPTVPGLETYTKVPGQVIERAFDFGAAMLENQRAFARKVLDASKN